MNRADLCKPFFMHHIVLNIVKGLPNISLYIKMLKQHAISLIRHCSCYNTNIQYNVVHKKGFAKVGSIHILYVN